LTTPVRGAEIEVVNPAPVQFAEANAWRSVGDGWRPLFGRYRDLGFSFEWHDFLQRADLEWGSSFHPGGIEICLNLEGTATIHGPREMFNVLPGTWTMYRQGKPPLSATRAGAIRHRFITIEYAPAFLETALSGDPAHVHPLVQQALTEAKPVSQVSPPLPMTGTLVHLVESLRNCPVLVPARETWFRSKALELISHLLFRPAEGELLCTRARRVGRERVERAQVILRERMREAPSLEELGRLVGCSPFYISRIFSQETGKTIPQYLRQIRLERAAELLRTGRCNVTEAALEVGYNSLSHFSTAFREAFHCCPGLYPVRTVPGLAMGQPLARGTVAPEDA
jgi:AraC-like DNA-binding protein